MPEWERIRGPARRELARVLRRIENGIAMQESINSLWQLCEDEAVDFGCLQAFMQYSLLYPERTLQILAASLQAADGQLNPHKVAFILCVNDEEQLGEAVLYLQNLHIPPSMEAEIIPVRGAGSMCAGYEQGRKLTQAKYKIYLHQDVLIIRRNLVEELLHLFKNPQVGIIGLAGCEKLPPSGIWWDGRGTHNIIAHALPSEQMVGSAGEVPCCQVQAVDGVLMATQYDIPWRADILQGWHFYDISLCQEYRRQGYQIVLPRQEEPWIIHQTRHTRAEEDYYEQQEIFLREYQPFC